MVFKDNQVENKEAKKLNSRRKFLLGAAKAAPVVTSMAALPVWSLDASISGNLSGNLSNRTYELAKYDGFSPGYYHMHTNNGSANGGCSNGSKLDCTEYQKTFKSIFNGVISSDPMNMSYLASNLNATVEQVLDPSNWGENPNGNGGTNTANGLEAVIDGQIITQVDRFALTAYYNAVNPDVIEFPYTQDQIKQFYSLYLEDPVTNYAEAKQILEYLIHSGNG
jgi:hypothetical protein